MLSFKSKKLKNSQYSRKEPKYTSTETKTKQIGTMPFVEHYEDIQANFNRNNWFGIPRPLIRTDK